mmetsp:Transcript_23813/g.46791  ORF Transcript_23813/g.46791 Transcript_23813/m.46791 type:complete len:292 (-) Transcript_23813:50-925(-)
MPALQNRETGARTFLNIPISPRRTFCLLPFTQLSLPSISFTCIHLAFFFCKRSLTSGVDEFLTTRLIDTYPESGPFGAIKTRGALFLSSWLSFSLPPLFFPLPSFKESPTDTKLGDRCMISGQQNQRRSEVATSHFHDRFPSFTSLSPSLCASVSVSVCMNVGMSLVLHDCVPVGGSEGRLSFPFPPSTKTQEDPDRCRELTHAFFHRFMYPVKGSEKTEHDKEAHRRMDASSLYNDKKCHKRNAKVDLTTALQDFLSYSVAGLYAKTFFSLLCLPLSVYPAFCFCCDAGA